MKKACLYSIMIAALATSFVLAGEKNKAAEQEYMKQAMAKELRRAKDSQKHHGNTERFEGKYGWAKEKQAEKYQAMMAANKKAEEAWAAVAKKGETASSPEDLSVLKIAAEKAASDAYVAEIALKLSAAADERKHMAEKTGDSAVKALSARLDLIENALLEAHRKKNEATLAVQMLEQESRKLNKTLRAAYEKAKAAAK